MCAYNAALLSCTSFLLYCGMHVEKQDLTLNSRFSGHSFRESTKFGQYPFVFTPRQGFFWGEDVTLRFFPQPQYLPILQDLAEQWAQTTR